MRAEETAEPEANKDGMVTKEEVANMIAEAVKNVNANKQKDEEDELASKVEALGLGISANAAKSMGVTAMKDVLAKNGTIAFNASTSAGYGEPKTAVSDYDMPE